MLLLESNGPFTAKRSEMRRCVALAMCLLLYLGVGQQAALGKKTRIKGLVTDSATSLPIPFASLSLKGSTAGTITTDLGTYVLETRQPGDTLVIACVGYYPKTARIKPGHFQELNISLAPQTIDMEEVVVRPDRNPALRMYDSIVAHKPLNNPDRLESYSARVYNRLEIDLSRVDTALFRKGAMKQLAFVKNHLDTNASTGKSFLPIFITEAISQHYHRPGVGADRELILASKLSGVENEGMAEFTGAMRQKFNIYDNYIRIFNQGLISPINDNGKLFYDYFLVDSGVRAGHWCYQLSFRPKRKYEPSFRGYLWVADSSYALVEAKYELSKEVNLNFVHYVSGEESYSEVKPGVWFPKSKYFFADINIAELGIGAFGHKTVVYDSVRLDSDVPRWLARENAQVVVADTALDMRDALWDSIRPLPLSVREKGIYTMVDSVKQLPLYRTAYDLGLMLTEYYYPLGCIDLGPYQRLVSKNPIEGWRTVLGIRTNKKLTRHVQLAAMGAYGFTDKRFKWRTSALWVAKRHPWRTLEAAWWHDMELLGRSPRSLTQDNILTTILREKWNYRLTLVDRLSLTYFHEFWNGLSGQIMLETRRIHTTPYVEFARSSGIKYPFINDARVEVELRWKHFETFITNTFYRRSLGSNYPEVLLAITGGLWQLPAPAKPNSFSTTLHPYGQVQLTLRQKVQLPPTGYSWILLGGGAIVGRVPYPLLELHEGNRTYAIRRFGFSMLDYYEFASDRWIQLLWEHHFMGLLFNHIPWVRRIGLREVVSGKMLVGTARYGNLHYFTPPEGLGIVGWKPYAEVSAGVENIFKVLRIEAVYRFGHIHTPGRWAVRAGLALQF